MFVSKEKESREAEPVEPSAFDKPVLLNAEAVNFPPKSSWKMKRVDGVYTVWQEDPKNGAEINIKKFPNFWLFCQDVNWIIKLISHGPAKTFCYKRLRLLQTRFHLHNMLNDGLERWETRNCLHRDFYNVRRVDNHVHHSACMTRKHLLRFIKSRLKGCPNVVVQEKGGKLITLTEFYNELKIKPHELSIDNLDIHSEKAYVHDVFQKSDEVTQLRTLFLKTDNYMKGRFLAELTKEVFEDFDQAKYNNAEFQLTISGKSANEWDKLASWVCRNNLQANHVKWSIQIPRVYSIFRLGNLVQNFEEMLDNIFRPLFEVTIDPSSHPDLHLFLQLVVSFDSVYDESLPERKLKNYPKPGDWDSTENPPYFVYSYYLYSNLFVLNSLREELGMNTFLWRPHSGESGDFGHLAVSFMIADSIQHGIKLKQTPVLQYLWYLAQIGIAMAPLSNNLFHLEYHKNPFPLFFTRGLNVTLSTDDPLMIHFTKEPLVEEYAIAAQLWKLSNIDMCEISRNSVLISGFSHSTKCNWLGNKYWKRGSEGNDISKTNVPNSRLMFREELLRGEEELLLCNSPNNSVGSPTSMRSVLNKRYLWGNRDSGSLLTRRSALVHLNPMKRRNMKRQAFVYEDEVNKNNQLTKKSFILIGLIIGIIFAKVTRSTSLKKSKQ